MVQGLYKNDTPVCLDINGAIDSKPEMAIRHEAFGQEWRFYPLENDLLQSEVETESIDGPEFAFIDSDEVWSDRSGSILDETEELSVDKSRVLSEDLESSD